MRTTGRIAVYYTLLVIVAAAMIIVALDASGDVEPEPGVAGVWAPAEGTDPCLGQSVVVRQSGQYVALAPDGTDGAEGKLRLEDGRLSGEATCADGARVEVDGGPAPEGLALRLDGREVDLRNTGRPVPPAGRKTVPPASLAGEYAASPPSPCFGSALELEGDGDEVHAVHPGRGTEIGTLEYDREAGTLRGEIECPAPLDETVQVSGRASDRTITLTPPADADEAAPRLDRVQLTKSRDAEALFGAFFLAVGVVMIAARFGGLVAVKLGQPRVMGEVLAGILLGPTLFGTVAPGLQSAIFPSDVIPYIGVAANLGLIFYMFLVGLEVDFTALRGRVAQTVAISNTGIALPLGLGMLVAVPIYEAVGTDKSFGGFALFMGVSMSITAFPVLARILVERRMLGRPVGALALSSAAIDDVSAWALIALASAVVGDQAGGGPVQTVLLAIAFTVFMVVVVRPLLARLSLVYDESGRVPAAWVVAIFAGVLASAYATEEIGIAIIFGAFIMGAIMPRNAGLSEDITGRLETFVITLLLPLFFVNTGLKTNMLLLDRASLLVITAVLCVVAIAGKLGGTIIAARFSGLGWRESAVLGTLMNTRGLTELIVLNLALEKGVISEALFAALVIMALLTTFMAGPLLKLLDPRNEFGEPPEETFEAALTPVAAPAGAAAAAPPPERKILVAPESADALPALLALAEPLARAENTEREIIVTRLLPPPIGATARAALQTENRELQAATRELLAASRGLQARGIHVRGAAFRSSDQGRDLARIAEREQVDLVLLDGHRPLRGGGVPKGEVAQVLEDAPPDVAVLIAREDHVLPPLPGQPVVVPFGGADHEWAALELAAWLASASSLPLRLLGAMSPDGTKDASRLLANASLLVQQFVGVPAEPVIASGSDDMIEHVADAGLLVIGMPDDWKDEGLGAARTLLTQRAPAPTLLVRRGTRTGVLAARGDVTRFSWTGVGAPASPLP